MTFEIGKSYATNDGRTVTVVGLHPAGPALEGEDGTPEDIVEFVFDGGGSHPMTRALAETWIAN